MDSISQQISSCQGLIYRVFQRRPLAGSVGFAVALVAAHPLAGTTHLTALLAESLNRDADLSAAAIDCRDLADSQHNIAHFPEKSAYRQEAMSPSSALSASHGNWRGSRDYRASYLAELRRRYAYVLIDCPSLKESTDVLGLAPLVDGVLLVIEANKTAKSQIGHLERTIESAEGKILGHLLNKRTYPIPEWVHGKMQQWGI